MTRSIWAGPHGRRSGLDRRRRPLRCRRPQDGSQHCSGWSSSSSVVPTAVQSAVPPSHNLRWGRPRAQRVWLVLRLRAEAIPGSHSQSRVALGGGQPVQLEPGQPGCATPRLGHVDAVVPLQVHRYSPASEVVNLPALGEPDAALSEPLKSAACMREAWHCGAEQFGPGSRFRRRGRWHVRHDDPEAACCGSRHGLSCRCLFVRRRPSDRLRGRDNCLRLIVVLPAGASSRWEGLPPRHPA